MTYRDGVETGRRIISREITIAPVNEVIEYGTQIPTSEPSDTPPSSGEGQAGTGTVGEQADQETTPPSSEQTPADTGQTEPQAGDQGTSKGEPEDSSVPSPTDTGTGQGPEVGHTQTGQSEPAAGQETTSSPAPDASAGELADPDTSGQNEGQEALTAVINKIDNLDQVPAILEGKDFDLYDIYLLDGEGNKVQPNQDVEITLALDNDKTVTQVLHLGQDLTDGQVDVLAFSQNANIVVFKTDHFSYFAIVYGQEAPAAGKVQVVDLSATETGEKESAAAGKDSASKADSTDSATASAETAESSSPALPSTGMGSMAAALGLSTILGGLGLVTKKKD